jgi:hypothetical protein
MFNETAFYSFLRNLNKEALRVQCKFWRSMKWALLNNGFEPADMYVMGLAQREYLADQIWISHGYGYEG